MKTRKEYLRDYHKAWVARNRERDQAYKKAWKASNPEAVKAQQSKSKKLHKETTRKRLAKIRATDPAFVIRHRLRSRLSEALKRQATVKKETTMKLIGCDMPTFKVHLESLFLPGMNWENRSLWHMDHKIPCIEAQAPDVPPPKIALV